MELNINSMLPALGERREKPFGSIIEFIEEENELDNQITAEATSNMSGTESNKGKGKATPSPTPSLEFVNISANGTSEEEKKRHKRAVRSAAMKSFRREQKSQQVQKKEKRGPTSDASSPPGVEQSNTNREGSYLVETFLASGEQIESLTPSDGQFSEHTWFGGGSPVPGEVKLDEAKLGFTYPEEWNALVPSNAPIHTQPGFSYLGAGRGDPFNLSILDAGPQAGGLIDHSLCTLWPGFRPSAPSSSGNRLAAAWHHIVRESPIIMHAFLYGAIVHLDVVHFPSINLDNPIRLYHKVQVLNLLRAELDLPPEAQAPLENLILAVLCLTSNEIETMILNTKNKITSPFNPPLPGLQWLDVYGAIIHIKEHTNALRDLVIRRGGLEAIELDGLAEVLSLSDILNACQFLTKPYWPLLQRTIDHVASKAIYEAMYIPRFQLEHLAQGFAPLRSVGITAELTDVLQLIANLTVTIDGYFRGSSPVYDLEHLIDRRNVTQYRLLSLPYGKELIPGEVNFEWLYEAIRWTALIYSIAVTFPLPPLGGIFHTLSSNLKATLESVGSTAYSLNIPKPLLWILTLGGIASSGTPLRAWYVENIRTLAKKMHLKHWDDVVAELRCFLWLDCSCEEGGRTLWSEVTGEVRH